jgi:hypothetical protein
MLSLSPRNLDTLDKENVGDRTRAIGGLFPDRPGRWLNDTSGKVPLRTIAFRAVLLPLTFRRATHTNHVRKLGTYYEKCDVYAYLGSCQRGESVL